jgi:hypothetical protein
MLRIIILLLLLSASTAEAQRKPFVDEKKPSELEFQFPRAEKKERYRIAVLTPMYLDSVDLAKNLTQIPKFMMPGIDFYQGVMIAADTLKKQGLNLDVYIYDSKSSYMNVRNLIDSDKLDSMDLIIGNASVADLKLLADFARKNLINFVSAVSPSDAGQDFNPYFTILQPRLASHIEKLHKHILSKYPEDNVLFIHRNQTAERNALGYFKNDILNPLPGRFSAMEIEGETLDLEKVRTRIDTNYNTTIVLGILDASATYNMLKALQPLASRRKLKIYCMPTTEAVKALNKTDEFPGMTIYYTTSYIIDRITPASLHITREYKSRMGSAPTDVVYKGFESLYYFAHLLRKHGVPFNEKISDMSAGFITPYKIVPVKENGKLRFFENKFLYLVHYEDGVMSYE